MKASCSIFWFRRDLRLEDNAGLYQALKGSYPVMPIFIFDPDILEGLTSDDARVTFIYDTITELHLKLSKILGHGIALYYGKPTDVLKSLIQDYDIDAVYVNHDYEPKAIVRDRQIQDLLKIENVPFHTFKDQVIFEKNEIVKRDGSPYVVYTPYMKKWKDLFQVTQLNSYNSIGLLANLFEQEFWPTITLEDMNFSRSEQMIKPFSFNAKLISSYEATRNFPGLDATTRLGPHLRFGTVSIRSIVAAAMTHANETFLNELIWREFFMQILWHFPYTVTKSFKPKYDRIEWYNNEDEFNAWCSGQTGYPLVDAGMRQLNETGFMHNRVRMLVSSFLCKHLLIDWRWGEAYFAEKLHDYEQASNVGNWQWAAGSGVDAAPYFRIFNPSTQIQKFDKDFSYIKTWVPDYLETTYPAPIVDHAFARERCLTVYKSALN